MGVDLVRAHQALYGEAKPVLHFVVLGDSVAVGGSGANDGHACDVGVAWVVQHNGSIRSTARMSKTNSYIGSWSGWTYLAQELYDLTGQRSIWTFIHKSSLTITKEAAPTRHLDFAYPGTEDGNFFWDSSEDYSRHDMFDRVLDIIADSPGWNVTARHLIWWGGATDAAALHDTTIDQSRIVGAYEDMLAYWKANYGASKLFIMGSGEIGTDEADAAYEQANSRDMAGLRAAQVTAASSTDIHTAFEQNPLRAATYNTFTVDGNGYWTAGQERYDGAHNVEAFNKAACKLAAFNIATALGLL